ncbi:hypothetical protein [Streptomyces albipurpureus]|uniref:Uncharacterized protein n=1 Tax=Streptomyces albipurpureus TaxID=2897419 RepID=A0ABT0UYX6_9ACTN|nr:hypothetical protein [Streptomyces sp. CWNU-1]MCM2393763.1 hypothetical protein [Streptomyces sp. CWNU-1]
MPPDHMPGQLPQEGRWRIVPDRTIPRRADVKTHVLRDFRVNTQSFLAMPAGVVIMIHYPGPVVGVLTAVAVMVSMRGSYLRYQRLRTE